MGQLSGRSPGTLSSTVACRATQKVFSLNVVQSIFPSPKSRVRQISRSFRSSLLRDSTSVANAPLICCWREELRSCESPSRSMMVICAGKKFKPVSRPSSPPSKRERFMEKQGLCFGAGVLVFEPFFRPDFYRARPRPEPGPVAVGPE